MGQSDLCEITCLNQDPFVDWVAFRERAGLTWTCPLSLHWAAQDLRRAGQSMEPLCVCVRTDWTDRR